MIFPKFTYSERRSKFLIPKVQLRNLEETQKAKKERILLLQSSRNFKDFTLNCTGVFSNRKKKNQVKSQSITINHFQVDKAVGSSSPIFDSFQGASLPQPESSKPILSKARISSSSKPSKRFKTLNITSPVFSLRKDFKVILAGEHIFPTIVLKN